ncbi:MAG: hypothetical protein R2940_15410 [Syntrophotaleaceae bacterium]
MQSTRRLFHVGAAIGVAISLASCAGVRESSYAYNDTYTANISTNAEGCYDAAVLLDKNIVEAREISMKVLAALDSTIIEEKDTFLKAQRNRHVGLFVGSGGEELFITLQEIPGNRTFVTAATKTGFVGGAGQKAWSCQIIDQIVAMASK